MPVKVVDMNVLGQNDADRDDPRYQFKHSGGRSGVVFLPGKVQPGEVELETKVVLPQRALGLGFPGG